MKIPFQDFKTEYSLLKNELDAAYQRVMESGWFILGREVEAFEQDFAKYCSAQDCISIGNGLDALTIIF